MSVASRVPSEVLGEIFPYAVAGPISNAQLDLFPWALGQVCKTWRDAFVTHPDLWTSISIDLPTSLSLRQDFDAIYRSFSLCLQRSEKRPLSITLHMPPHPLKETTTTTTAQDPRPIWKLFMSCSTRWSAIVLTGISDARLRDMNTCKGKTPILQSLTIQTSGGGGGGNVCDAFEFAPALTQFNLYFSGYTAVNEWWALGWAQLTKMTLKIEGSIGLDVLKAVMACLKKIEELRITLQDANSSIEERPLLPIRERLEHLRILEVPCIPLLSLLQAPSLYELHLTDSSVFFEGGNFFAMKSQVDAFIRGSSCKIQKLTLEGIEEHAMVPLLSSLLHVEELNLDLAPSSLPLIEMPAAFSKLHTLSMTLESVNDYPTLKVLDEIIRSRNKVSLFGNVGTRLDTVIIKLQGPDAAAAKPDRDGLLRPPAALQSSLFKWAEYKVKFQFKKFSVESDPWGDRPIAAE
jgi:hypothetical protein